MGESRFGPTFLCPRFRGQNSAKTCSNLLTANYQILKKNDETECSACSTFSQYLMVEHRTTTPSRGDVLASHLLEVTNTDFRISCPALQPGGARTSLKRKKAKSVFSHFGPSRGVVTLARAVRMSLRARPRRPRGRGAVAGRRRSTVWTARASETPRRG